MNILLENVLENDIKKCYNQLDKLNNTINNAYLFHDELTLKKEEIKLINLMKNIRHIANLRNKYVS